MTPLVPKKLVFFRVDLEVELKSHSKEQDNTVLPVPAPKKYLGQGVSLFHTIFGPAQLAGHPVVRELVEWLQVGRPELGRIIQPCNHVVHEADIGSKPASYLLIL